MASLIGLRFLSAQETHWTTLHLLWPRDKHTTTLPFRFLPRLAGCSGWCRGAGIYGRLSQTAGDRPIWVLS